MSNLVNDENWQGSMRNKGNELRGVPERAQTPYARKSNPNILIPWYWRVLVQGEVGSRSVVIVQVQQKDMAEVPFARHNDMIKAFPPHRANQPFRIRIPPWRARRNWPVTNAHSPKPPGENLAIDPVAIARCSLASVPNRRLR
jgi:hypothetical protein